MSGLHEIQNALKSRISGSFTAAKSVNIVPVRGASQLHSYITPLVEIVFAGGPYSPSKGSSGGMNRFDFQVFIVQVNWAGTDVTTGGGGATGLAEMIDTLLPILDDYRLTDELGGIISAATIESYIGTGLHPVGDGSNYAASIGLQISYYYHV